MTAEALKVRGGSLGLLLNSGEGCDTCPNHEVDGLRDKLATSPNTLIIKILLGEPDQRCVSCPLGPSGTDVCDPYALSLTTTDMDALSRLRRRAEKHGITIDDSHTISWGNLKELLR